jgi:hypothetical protein
MGPFSDVPRTARGHLGLLFYEAALAVIAHVHARARRNGQAIDRVFESFPSLHDYAAELRRRMPDALEWASSGAWLRDQIDAWEREGELAAPIASLGRELAIARDAQLMLIVLGLVEEDAAFAELFATLQAPLGHRRPTLGLLRELTRTLPSDASGEAWPLVRPLVDSGFAEIVNGDAPRSEWTFRVPPPIWTALRGERPAQPMPGLAFRSPASTPAIEDLIVGERQRARLHQVRHLLATTPAHTLIVRGMAGSERLEIAAALAAAIGRGVLEVTALPGGRDETLARLGPLGTLLHAVPVFCPDLGPSETFVVPRLAGYCGPIAVVLGREGGVGGTVDAVTIEAEPDTAARRRRHWERALEGRDGTDASRIAETFTISGRYIRQCAPIAVACAALDGRSAVEVNDVRQASRTINRQALESLATPIDGTGAWEHLVLGSGTEADLHDLERRCRHRERLAASVGEHYPGGLTRGVRALFEGPSGTGKTLAARVIAAAVGLDLYRVDLASVINKYIGETEKNLSRILSRAEDLDVVLLLDEGDALLSRRTDVKSSNDRYANLETNYLLQRLDNYDGIVIVTTNLGGQIDPAFRRRMDVVARFHLPDPEQRWRLWQLHLPAGHAVDGAVLEEASVRYALTGGQIRNAALYATLAALARGGRVERADLVSGIELEHRKAGASFHGDPAVDGRDSGAALDRFMGAIS